MKTVPCKSCKEPVAFVKTITGKMMPIDPTPVEDGNIVLEVVEGATIAHVFGPPMLAAHTGDRHKSHFATCRFAQEHRRAKA